MYVSMCVYPRVTLYDSFVHVYTSTVYILMCVQVHHGVCV